jgi:hypothetical protein
VRIIDGPLAPFGDAAELDVSASHRATPRRDETKKCNPVV